LRLELTEVARQFPVRLGSNPTYAERPLKRAIQRDIETLLARLIPQGNVRDGQKVMVDCHPGSGELRFNPAEEPVLPAPYEHGGCAPQAMP
jgi:ATP-dependent Clp protease ATP-binding subunit ClpB